MIVRTFGVDLFTYDPYACCLLAILPETWPHYRIAGIVVLCSLWRVGSLHWTDFVRVNIAEPALWWPSIEPVWGDDVANAVDPTVAQDLVHRLPHPFSHPSQLGLLFVWIAPQHRRRGIMRRMLEVAATKHGQQFLNFPLVPPLTDDARAAAMALFPGTVAVGEPEWTRKR